MLVVVLDLIDKQHVNSDLTLDLINKQHVNSDLTCYLLLKLYYIVTNKGNNKLPNSEQSYKGKVKTHNYINRQNQSTTEKL